MKEANITKISMKVGDKVEWYEDRYSSFKQYGAIIKLNKKTARVRDDDAFEHILKLDSLNWS